MIPCSSCRLERSCYWSRARWQPFECRYPPYSRSELQQCLLNRKVLTNLSLHGLPMERKYNWCIFVVFFQLIFVGDSTNRGLMEALLERLDGWLTMSDRYCCSIYHWSSLSISSWLIGHFSLLSDAVYLVGQSGTVIATVLPTSTDRHNSTLTIIPNSGCLRGPRWNRLLSICSAGISTKKILFSFASTSLHYARLAWFIMTSIYKRVVSCVIYVQERVNRPIITTTKAHKKKGFMEQWILLNHGRIGRKKGEHRIHRADVDSFPLRIMGASSSSFDGTRQAHWSSSSWLWYNRQSKVSFLPLPSCGKELRGPFSNHPRRLLSPKSCSPSVQL